MKEGDMDERERENKREKGEKESKQPLIPQSLLEWNKIKKYISSRNKRKIKDNCFIFILTQNTISTGILFSYAEL